MDALHVKRKHPKSTLKVILAESCQKLDNNHNNTKIIKKASWAVAAEQTSNQCKSLKAMIKVNRKVNSNAMPSKRRRQSQVKCQMNT